MKGPGSFVRVARLTLGCCPIFPDTNMKQTMVLTNPWLACLFTIAAMIIGIFMVGGNTASHAFHYTRRGLGKQGTLWKRGR